MHQAVFSHLKNKTRKTFYVTIENLIENTNDPLGTRITGIASLV